MELQPLRRGVLLRRYKRFFAEVALDGGEVVLAHCPNPGAMTGCATPGSVAFLSHHSDPKRKLAWTLELTTDAQGCRIIVNTARANVLVHEALMAGKIPAFDAYKTVLREVRFGESRMDFSLRQPGLPDTFIEVKSVTMMGEEGLAAFPDSVTERGARHMRELAGAVAAGHRAAVVFLVAREGARAMRPADEIDPAYGAALRAALRAGVEALALQVEFGDSAVRVGGPLPVLL